MCGFKEKSQLVTHHWITICHFRYSSNESGGVPCMLYLKLYFKYDKKRFPHTPTFSTSSNMFSISLQRHSSTSAISGFLWKELQSLYPEHQGRLLFLGLTQFWLTKGEQPAQWYLLRQHKIGNGVSTSKERGCAPTCAVAFDCLFAFCHRFAMQCAVQQCLYISAKGFLAYIFCHIFLETLIVLFVWYFFTFFVCCVTCMHWVCCLEFPWFAVIM